MTEKTASRASLRCPNALPMGSLAAALIFTDSPSNDWNCKLRFGSRRSLQKRTIRDRNFGPGGSRVSYFAIMETVKPNSRANAS